MNTKTLNGFLITEGLETKARLVTESDDHTDLYVHGEQWTGAPFDLPTVRIELTKTERRALARALGDQKIIFRRITSAGFVGDVRCRVYSIAPASSAIADMTKQSTGSVIGADEWAEVGAYNADDFEAMERDTQRFLPDSVDAEGLFFHPGAVLRIVLDK